MGDSRDIARFRSAELIGRGGFGSVYRATDDQHGRDVAIKVLQGSLGETERRRFDRERQTMGRLGSHPNIIPVHESGYTPEGEGYIVMELATGGSLRDRLEAEGRIPWREAVAVMVAIANAAQAAHEQGVLHRDIKPDNILMDSWGNPRLTDFGIASVASNATATTSTTATVAHAAPEVLQGRPSTAGVDIYAIGSTLYNLITGLPPFQRPEDEGVPAMITRALTEPPPDLRQYGVPDAVSRVAEQSLAKELSHRQPTARQLANDLAASAAAAGDVDLGGLPPPPAGATVVTSPPQHDPGQLPAPPPSGPYPHQALVGQHTPYPPPAGQGPPGTAPPHASTLAGGVFPPPTVDRFGGVDQHRPPAPPKQGSGGRAVWILVAVGLVAVLGITAIVLVAQNAAREGEEQADDDRSETDSSSDDGSSSGEELSGVRDDSSSSSSTSSSTTSTTQPTTTTTTTTTTTAPSTSAFFGVDFNTPLSWNFGGAANFDAQITTQGQFGEASVSYVDVNGTFVTVVEDLTLTQLDDGSWGYVGSNPRFSADGSAAPYTPDTFTFFFDEATNLYYFDSVCNDFYGRCTFDLT